MQADEGNASEGWEGHMADEAVVQQQGNGQVPFGDGAQFPPKVEEQAPPVGGAYVTASDAAALPNTQIDPIQPKAITVHTGRIAFDVEIPDARFRYTTPRLSAFVNGQYPDLPHHACVNDVGETFGYVMERTSVAHLLEHLIISEQVSSHNASSDTFVGTTEWTDEAAGRARIEVAFRDDLIALRAFNEATRFLNIAVLTCLA